MDRFGGALSSLGAVLVTVIVKFCVTEAGRGSETVIDMVYIPVYVIDIDLTNNVNAEGSVNIPLGIFTVAPPFRE
jgi:hypothetical protein